MDAITFTVYGKPQPGGSKKAFVIPGTNRASVSDANPKAKDWKNAVACTARSVYEGSLLTGPVEFKAVFYFPRPKGHYRTGKNSHLLRDSAPTMHTTKPDALKCARSVEDALTKVVWLDDSQICRESLEKVYGEPARVEITVTPLAGTP